MNLSCIARDVVVVRANSGFSNWGIVYNQYAINGTNLENRTGIYYENSSGFKIRLANDYGTNTTCTGGTCNIITIGETKKYLDAFYDSGSNKIFIIYDTATNGQPNTVDYAKLISYDVASGSISSLATYSTTPLTFLFRNDGVTIKQINSTHYYVARLVFRSGGSGDNGIFLTRWNINTGLAEATIQPVGGTGSAEFGTSLYYNRTHLLLGFHNASTTMWYWSFNESSLATPTFQQSFFQAATNYGPYIYDNHSALFYSSKDGNQELYFVLLNGSFATRLTTTARNEFIGNVLNLSDNTQLFTYWETTTNNAYLESFCASSPAPAPSLGTNCTSVPIGGLCLPCFQSNGTVCVPVANCFFIPPSVDLVAKDYACANSVGVPHVSGSCRGGTGATIQDWIYADYRIAGKTALPANVAITDPNTQTNASATCSLCDATTSNCVAMNYSDTTSLRFNFPQWSLEVRESNRYPIDSTISILCNSSVSGTFLYGFLRVANTEVALSAYDLKIGSGSTGFNNTINANETPLFKESIYTTGAPYGGYNMIDSACTFTFLGQDNPTAATHSEFIPDIFFLNEYQKGATGTFALTAGYYGVSSRCQGVSVASDLSKRSPLIAQQKSFLVLDACTTLGYFNSSLTAAVKDVDANDTTFFEQGEHVFLYGAYNVGNAVWNNGACTAQINNATSGAILTSPTLMSQTTGGTYSACLASDPSDYRLGVCLNNGIGAGAYALAAGNYSATISCYNTDTSVCVLPQSKTVNFTVNVSDGCAGTADACTTGTCSACSPKIVTCENGRQVTVAAQCISRSCKEPTFSISNGVLPEACQFDQRWSISSIAQPNTLSCGSDDVTIITTFLDNGVPIPPVQANLSMSCKMTVFASAVVAPGSTIQNSQQLLFDVPIPNTATIDYSLAGRLDAFKFANCGVRHAATVSCYSPSFTGGVKEATAFFYIGAQGQDCVFNGKIVKDGQCVNAVTGVDADKPKICYSASFQNNSASCSCPVGTTVNASTNGCDGSTIISSGVEFFAFKWLSLWNLLLIIIFVPLLLKAYSVYKSGKPIINLPPMGKK